MVKNVSLPIISLFQAAVTVLYCIGVVFLMTHIESVITISGNEFTAPLIFLMIFVVSALITGSIVLGYPIYLVFSEKNVKKAFQNIGYTILWFIVLLVVTVTTASLAEII